MENDASETKTTEESPKITSVVKSERIKDPRRVAQGKKLAAISRQAKERKAKEGEAKIREEEADRCEEERESYLNASNGMMALIPVILLGGYYLFYLRKKEPEGETKGDNDKEEEEEGSYASKERKPNLECL